MHTDEYSYNIMCMQLVRSQRTHTYSHNLEEVFGGFLVQYIAVGGGVGPAERRE